MLRKHWRKTEGGGEGGEVAAVVAALECRCRNSGAAPWIRHRALPSAGLTARAEGKRECVSVRGCLGRGGGDGEGEEEK